MKSHPLHSFAAIAALAISTLASTASAEPTPIRLFSGVELTVKPGDTPLPILSIEDNRFVLGDETHSRVYPVDAGSFSAQHAIKLSRTPLIIERLRAIRTYTPDTDPVMQGMIIQNEVAAQAQIKQAVAEQQRMDGEGKRAVQYPYAKANSDAAARGERMPYEFMPTVAELEADSAADLAALTEVYENLASTANSTVFDDLRSRAGDDEAFDALDMLFYIASPTPVRDAYVVIVAHIAEEGEKRLRTFYEAIGDLDPKPRRVYLRRAGFKPGFEVTDITVHVYARGQELVSNLSAKNTPLTAEQTRDFLLLTYLGENATESLAAQPVWSLVPPALLAAKSAAPFDRTVAVNIDADGRLISIHDSLADARAFVASIQDAKALRTRDTPKDAPASFAASVRLGDDTIQPNQSQHVPAPIVAALQDMFFLPALDVGQPVVSTTELNLAAFFP